MAACNLCTRFALTVACRSMWSVHTLAKNLAVDVPQKGFVSKRRVAWQDIVARVTFGACNELKVGERVFKDSVRQKRESEAELW